MRVLLTGGQGFVGQHLVRLLESRADRVRAPSSADLDVTRPELCRRHVATASPELVVHLAALTDPAIARREPERARQVNVGGTATLLAALAEHAPEARVVVVSTCHVYGRPRTLPVTESHRCEPTGTYGRTKAEAEQVALASGLDVVIARPFHLTGPGQPLARAPADWARQAAAGARRIRVGDLSLHRDYLDVRDACRALVRLGERGERGGTYNVCSGETVELGWILATVAPGAVAEVDPERLRPGEVTRLVGDPSPLRALGWRPTVPLEQSLVELRRGS